MTSERDFDRLARAWLELGPDEAPDRVVAAVLQAADTMPQVRRRFAWPTWRPFQMNRLLLFAGAAVLLVAFIGGGVFIGGGRAPSSTAFPSQDAAASAAPPASSSPASSDALRVPGLDTDLRPVGTPLASMDVGYVVPGMQLAKQIVSDGTTLWVSKYNEVVGIDPSTSTVTAHIPLPGDGYYNGPIAASPGAIWVSGPEIPAASIQALDSKTGKVVATIPVTEPGWWLYSDGSVWVTEPSTSTVIRIDAASHNVVARIRVGSVGQVVSGGNFGGDIAAGDGSILVGNDIDQTIARIDPKTNKVVATVHAAPLPLTLTVAASTIWGASWDDSGGHLMKTDATTGRSSWTTDFQGGISNPLVRPDAVWLGFLPSTGIKAGALAAIDPATGKVIDGLSIPDGQVTATFEAFGSVWLVLGQQGLVERFSPDVLTVKH